VTAPEPRITVATAFLAWWRDNLHHRGFWPTLRFFLAEMWDFLRDSTPARQRQRYGDIDFDWEHRVDTTEATVSLRNRFLGVFHSAYQPTAPEAFHEMIGQLGIDYSQFTFLDLGSGKGRTLLMAAEYPFRRILGVELIPELHRIAEENIARFKGGLGDRVQSICADARTFAFPPDPTVLFLFNPFPHPVLEEVLQRLMRSLADHKRTVYLIYHNPVLELVLAQYPDLKLIRRGDQYSIFVTGL
jgi:SAM-dependent methyltransferase